MNSPGSFSGYAFSLALGTVKHSIVFFFTVFFLVVVSICLHFLVECQLAENKTLFSLCSHQFSSGETLSLARIRASLKYLLNEKLCLIRNSEDKEVIDAIVCEQFSGKLG